MPHDVAILKCSDYSRGPLYRSIKDAVGLLGGMERFVKKGERILLKPNMLGPKGVETAVTTHPAVVRAVVELVREAGGTAVVGDSPGIGSAARVARKCGIMDVLKELSVDIVELDVPVVVDYPSALTFKRLEIARAALDADGIINLPKLKTHAQMYLTMGVKNIFGCVAGRRKAQWHLTAGVDTGYFAEMLIDLYRCLSPRLTIMDAVISMEGNGPASGEPRQTGFIAASAEAIALDRVMAEILGARAQDVPILKRAIEKGLIRADLTDINVLGQPIDGVRVRGFKFPPLVNLNFGAFLPGVVDRHVRKALTARPEIDPHLCKRCGLCGRVCPAGKISGKERIVIDPDGCIRCYCCQEMCPWGAITVKQGWIKKIIPGL